MVTPETWTVVFTRQAQKDAKKLAAAKLRRKAEELLELLRSDPFQSPPPYEKLVGVSPGLTRAALTYGTDWSTRFSKTSTKHVVKIIRLWSHYE